MTPSCSAAGPAHPAAAERGFRVRGLGEIAIRCADLDAMERFYADVIGLERLAERENGIVFFRIGPGRGGHGGHTTVLALFAHDADVRRGLHPTGTRPSTGAASSLHHLALTVDWAAQQAAMAWYARQGLAYRVERFDWIGWRGVFTHDPDGNTVELVAADPDARP
ncbi:MAG: VOC family protein [Pseudomonadota bacterium]